MRRHGPVTVQCTDCVVFAKTNYPTVVALSVAFDKKNHHGADSVVCSISQLSRKPRNFRILLMTNVTLCILQYVE